MSADIGGESDVQRTYSGLLIVGPLSIPSMEKAHELAAQEGLTIDVTPSTIEFEYVGRDTNRFVVRFLHRLARLLGTARGEITCEIAGDAHDIRFEFYKCRDGRLYRQRAHLVREREEEVRAGGMSQ